jgi:glycosyltransferase involved in cell wall biosynthesis
MKIYFVSTGYNCENYIRECFDSLLCQTSNQWHCVFVDDCSVDNTFHIAKQYEIKYPIFFTALCNNERSYKAVGFQRAVSLINSDSIIAELDVDDELACSNTVEELLLLHKKFDLVWTQHTTINKSSRYWDVWRSTRLPSKWNRNHPKRSDIWSKIFFPGHMRTFKKFLYDKIDPACFYYKGDPIKVAFDLVYYTSLLEITPIEYTCFYNKVCYKYVIRDNNDQFIEDDITIQKGINEKNGAFCQTIIEKWFKSLPALDKCKYEKSVSLNENEKNKLMVILKKCFYRENKYE